MDSIKNDIFWETVPQITFLVKSMFTFVFVLKRLIHCTCNKLNYFEVYMKNIHVHLLTYFTIFFILAGGTYMLRTSYFHFSLSFAAFLITPQLIS